MDLTFEKASGLGAEDTVFIHGNLASPIWWKPMLYEWSHLGPMGTKSLLFSNWSEMHGSNLRNLAEAHFRLMDRNSIEQAALVGHSLGGLIALQMAVLRPERVSRLVLLDPVGVKGVVFDDSMYEAFRQMAASPTLTKSVILSTIEGADRLPVDFAEQIATDAYRAVKGIGTSVLEILKTVDLSKEVRQLKMPIHIAHGAKDQVIPLSDSQLSLNYMPHAVLQVLPDNGHCWNVENPSAFTEWCRKSLIASSRELLLDHSNHVST